MESVSSFLQNILKYKKSYQNTTQIKTFGLKSLWKSRKIKLEKLKKLELLNYLSLSLYFLS
jgi:hypothetical protein